MASRAAPGRPGRAQNCPPKLPQNWPVCVAMTARKGRGGGPPGHPSGAQEYRFSFIGCYKSRGRPKSAATTWGAISRAIRALSALIRGLSRAISKILVGEREVGREAPNYISLIAGLSPHIIRLRALMTRHTIPLRYRHQQSTGRFCRQKHLHRNTDSKIEPGG